MASSQTAFRKMISPALAASLLVLLLPAGAAAAPSTFDLSSPANGAWCTATCKFAWQSATSATSYDLYIDGALKKSAIAATYQPSYTLATGESIADGWHTWHVVARDSGGTTTQSASTWSVRVDSTPPASFTITAPLTNAWVPSSPVTFAWTPSSDAQSGLDHYEVWINGVATSTAVPSSATTAAVPLPQTTLYTDSVSGCSPWVRTGNWYCTANGAQPQLAWPGNCCDRGRSGSAVLTTPIDLSGAGQVTLQFQYQADVGTYATYRARFSDDNGATWSTVFTAPLGSIGWIPSTADLPMAGTANARIEFTASDSVWVDWWNIQYVNIQGILGGVYASQVVAVDVAGNRTAVSQSFHYDLPPVPFDLVGPVDRAWTTNTTPTFAWNATTTAGPGLAKHQVWIDGNLAVDNISATATTASPTSALTDGTHSWQVCAVDAAGAVRCSRETYSVGIDTTPPAAFSLYSPADQSTSVIPTPTFCWNPASDAGSGLDHYQLMIDGSLSRDGITGICSTPTASLAEGAHTWSVKAIDGVGNSRDATETWTVRIDFNPPTGFVLLTPGNGAAADAINPTFTWGASSDTASGLSHYELRIDGVCVACSIPSTSTSYTLTAPLTVGAHTWSMTAVDGVGGSTVATGAPWTFTAQECAPGASQACAGNSTGACTPGTRICSDSGTWGSCAGVVTSVPENCGNGIDDDCDGLVDCADPDCAAACAVGSEPGPEPSRDAGVDLPADSLPDIVPILSGPEVGPESGPEPSPDVGFDLLAEVGPDAPTETATATATWTATGTTTATQTSSSTTTSTATGTSASPEPQPDGSSMMGADAPIVLADAASSDVASVSDADIARDGLAADVLLGPTDAWTATPMRDAASGSNIPDGGLALADASVLITSDAKVAAPDGGPSGAADGSKYDAGVSGKSGSSGCGCAVGGHDARNAWGVSLVVLGLLGFWRRSRGRQRHRADR